jgi:hypothetical protein
MLGSKGCHSLITTVRSRLIFAFPCSRQARMQIEALGDNSGERSADQGQPLADHG